MLPIFFFSIVTSLSPVGDDALLKQLDADFAALLKTDPNADQLRRAAKQLEGIKEDSKPEEKLAALLILRKTRSKAGIPLLMKWICLRADWVYVDTLILLTGQDIPMPWAPSRSVIQRAREIVEQLNTTWWQPGKDTITTDLEKMSLQEREMVAFALIASNCQTGYVDCPDRSAAFDLSQSLTAFRYQEAGCSHSQQVMAEELHPTVLPALLRASGKPERVWKDSPPCDAKDGYLALDIVPLLAKMYAKGNAADLPKIAADKDRTVATRLTCLMALHRAGQELKVDMILPLLMEDCRQESKIAAVLLLERCVDLKDATPVLVKLFGGEDEDLRSAAILALRSTRAPKEVLPHLQKVLKDVKPQQLVRATLQVLANMHRGDATATLADFLQTTLDDKERVVYLRDALAALEQATGKEWMYPNSIGFGRGLEAPDIKADAQRALEEWHRR